MTAVDFTPCSRMVVVVAAAAAASTATARVLVWSAVSGQILRWLDGAHQSRLITRIAWLGHGCDVPPLLLTTDTDGCLAGWRITAEPTGGMGPLWTTCVASTKGDEEQHSGPSIVCLAASHDAHRIAVGQQNGWFYMLDAATRRVIAQGHSSAAATPRDCAHPVACGWSADGLTAIALHSDGVVRGWGG